jgi:hypothetical protein
MYKGIPELSINTNHFIQLNKVKCVNFSITLKIRQFSWKEETVTNLSISTS